MQTAFERLCLVLLIASANVAVSACGGGGQEAAPAPTPPVAEPAPPPAPAPAPAPVVATPDGEGIVRITANDQMRFSANRIEVKAGEPVKIELKNIGSMPKEAMGHNLVVLKPGIVPSAYAQTAMSAKESEYVPAAAHGDVLGYTKLLGPGESVVLELAPLEAGSYPFLCSFPGHVGLMNGELVAQ